MKADRRALMRESEITTDVENCRRWDSRFLGRRGLVADRINPICGRPASAVSNADSDVNSKSVSGRSAAPAPQNRLSLPAAQETAVFTAAASKQQMPIYRFLAEVEIPAGRNVRWLRRLGRTTRV